MKKLKIKLAGTAEPLTKEQMKTVTGGTDPVCQINCYDADYNLAGSVTIGSLCQTDSSQFVACLVNGYDISYADCFCY